MSLTFLLAVVGWIIFRSDSMTQFFEILSAMVKNKFIDMSATHGISCLLYGILLLVVEWFQRDKQHALQFPDIKLFNHRVVRWSVYYLIVMIIFIKIGSSQTFIYFQF